MLRVEKTKHIFWIVKWLGRFNMCDDLKLKLEHVVHSRCVCIVPATFHQITSVSILTGV